MADASRNSIRRVSILHKHNILCHLEQEIASGNPASNERKREGNNSVGQGSTFQPPITTIIIVS